MAALVLAFVSIAAADSVYHAGRTTQRCHSLWVALSIAAMCLPILGWMTGVFLGPGAPAWSLVGAVEAALFAGLYRNLRNLPAVRKLGHGLPPPGEKAGPPAEKVGPPAGG
jgi:hypothetical protein